MWSGHFKSTGEGIVVKSVHEANIDGNRGEGDRRDGENLI